MARCVFFSFHYERDIWRVNQIRNLHNVVSCAAAGFQDASLWERTKRSGDAAIKRLIDDGLKGTTVTVVCIGYQTALRTYVNYEIQQSIARGNGLLGVQIYHLKDRSGQPSPAGAIPAKLSAGGYKSYKYVDHHRLKDWIEAAATAAGH